MRHKYRYHNRTKHLSSSLLSTTHKPLPEDPSPLAPVFLNPIRLAYSTSSLFVTPSPLAQLALLLLGLNFAILTLKSSSIEIGLIGPNSSSGFRVACRSRAARSSGDSAQSGRLKSVDFSESSESEYLTGQYLALSEVRIDLLAVDVRQDDILRLGVECLIIQLSLQSHTLLLQHIRRTAGPSRDMRPLRMWMRASHS
jgi:hypothetical protein